MSTPTNLTRLLSATEILAAEDIKRELVHVPEWGGSVWVYGLSGAEKDAYDMEIIRLQREMADKKQVRANVRAFMVMLACRDEQGRPIFTQQDLIRLGKKSAKALERLSVVARRLGGVDESEANEEIEIENFDNGQRSNSSTD